QAFRGDVIAHGRAQRIELERPALRAALARGHLHGGTFPLLFVAEAHEQHGLLRIEALDDRLYIEIAVAPDGRIAGLDEDAPYRHGFDRQRRAEQQMPAAIAPGGLWQ